MGRPAQISADCLRKNQMTHMSWPRRRSSLSSAKRSYVGMRSPPGMTACVVLLWAVLCCFSFSSASSSQDLDSELVETETGWQFDDDIDVFDGNATAPAPAPAAKAISGRVPLADGDFETCNVTGNASVLATDATVIPNWLPGGAGVNVIRSAGYKMSNFDKNSKFAIHLNNPISAANGTQGSIAANLATNPATGKSFTVQFDCARMPDGPINLLSALKVSSVSGTTTNSYVLHKVKYNATDTAMKITWSRMSYVYEGTGAATKIQFESMSEKYGPLIDNVVILTGKHPLSAAPSAKSHLSVWQRMCPLFTVVVAMAFHCHLSQPLSLL